MFFSKKQKVKEYDRERLTPAVRSGICTGEKVAGFIENKTGNFREELLIRSPEDLESFKQKYGLAEIETFY